MMFHTHLHVVEHVAGRVQGRGVGAHFDDAHGGADAVRGRSKPAEAEHTKDRAGRLRAYCRS